MAAAQRSYRSGRTAGWCDLEEWVMPDKGKSGPKGKGGTKPPPGKTGKGKK